MYQYPLISIVMPTYNGSRTIKKAIQSILNQDYPNFEIIVVDDASIDNTSEIVKSIDDKRIRLIVHSQNRNGSAARNTGIKATKGQYIAFLDDDDEWLPNKLTLQLKYLQNKDENIWRAVICSHDISSGNRWRTVTLEREGDITKEILMMQMSLAAGSSLMIKKDAIEKVGYFDENYPRHQDMNFVLRYLRFFKLGTMKESLSVINGHSGVPSGEKMLKVKEIFLKDFEKDIQNLGPKVAKKIYARQWLQVSQHFALDGNFKQTTKYYFKSLSFALLLSNYFKILPLENYLTIPYYLLRSRIFKVKMTTR